MASGAKEMVTNSLERAVSTDLNRTQKFSNAHRAEFFRARENTYHGTDDFDAGGLVIPNTTQGTPLAAEVEGLLVQPQTGSFNLLVTSGIFYAANPDSASDDSAYKTVEDAGVQTLGVLTMSGNAAGTIRIDVIECQNTVNNTLETDSRDIFNPATGAFTPVSVTKAVGGQLTYRVRQGTPGSGYPGAAAGWLPLAVAAVPASGVATSNNQITFWDVRPLTSGRIYSPFNTSMGLGAVRRADLALDINSSAGHAFLSGVVECFAADVVTPVPALYRLGGSLNAIDLSLAIHQSGALGTGPVYVYLLEPFGLPRWAQYTPTGTRQPMSPRGVLVASPTAPFQGSNTPSSPIALPAGTGLGSSAAKGVCIVVTHATGGAVDAAVVGNGVTQHAGNLATPVFTNLAGVLSGGNQIATFTSVPGTNHPPHAKALIVALSLPLATGGAAASGEATVEFVDAFGNTIVAGTVSWVVSATLGYQLNPTFRVPIVSSSSAIKIVCLTNSASATFSSAVMIVLGWEV